MWPYYSEMPEDFKLGKYKKINWLATGGKDNFFFLFFSPKGVL